MPFCCYPGCPNDAAWMLSCETDPDTYACTAHVGEMLTDAPLHWVEPLEFRLSDYQPVVEYVGRPLD